MPVQNAAAPSPIVRAPIAQPVTPVVSRTVPAPAPVPKAAPNPLSLPSAQQLRRYNNVRTQFHAEQVAANARPPVLEATTPEERPLPSVEELVNLLAPYHVHQDMDNTPEALEKGEGKAMREIESIVK